MGGACAAVIVAGLLVWIFVLQRRRSRDPHKSPTLTKKADKKAAAAANAAMFDTGEREVKFILAYAWPDHTMLIQGTECMSCRPLTPMAMILCCLCLI